MCRLVVGPLRLRPHHPYETCCSQRGACLRLPFLFGLDLGYFAEGNKVEDMIAIELSDPQMFLGQHYLPALPSHSKSPIALHLERQKKVGRSHIYSSRRDLCIFHFETRSPDDPEFHSRWHLPPTASLGYQPRILKVPLTLIFAWPPPLQLRRQPYFACT